MSFYFIPLKNALPSLEKEFFEKTLPSRVAGVFQKAIREMELHQRAIQGFDIFQCGILGIAGTASVVHRGLREMCIRDSLYPAYGDILRGGERGSGADGRRSRKEKQAARETGNFKRGKMCIRDSHHTEGNRFVYFSFHRFSFVI